MKRNPSPIALLVLLSLLVPPARAAAPRPDVDRMAWTALAAFRLANTHDSESLALVAAANRLMRDNPNASAMRTLTTLEKIRADFRASGEYQRLAGSPNAAVDVTRALIDTATRSFPLADAANKVATALGDYLLKMVDRNLEYRERGTQDVLRSFAGEKLRENQAEELNAIWNAAQQDPRFAEVANALLSEQVHATTRDSAETIETNNGDFDAVRLIRQDLGPDGELTVSTREIRNQLGQVLSGLEQTRVDVADAGAQGSENVLNWLRAQADLQAATAREAEVARRNEEKSRIELESARSAVGLLSKFVLIAGHDPKLANEISVIGGAGVTIAESIHTFNTAAKAVDTASSVVGTLSCAVATMNVAGAVLGIFDLFGPSGPSADQQILDEVGHVETMISDLAKGIDKRFDLVDLEINTGFKLMNDRFNAITRQLGQLETSVARIEDDIHFAQQTIFELQSRVERLHSDLARNLDDGFSQERLRLLERCAGPHRHVEPSGQMSFATIQGCLSDLSVEAVSIARDSNALAPEEEWKRPFADRNWAEFRKYLTAPLARSLVMLDLLAPKIDPGFPVVDRDSLRNPVRWGEVAGAYSQVIASQAWYLKFVPSSGVNTVLQAGEAIEDLRLTLVSKPAADGRRKPDAGFFHELFGRYESAASILPMAFDRAGMTASASPGNFWHPERHNLISEGLIPSIAPPCEKPSADGTAEAIQLPPEVDRFIPDYAKAAVLAGHSEVPTQFPGSSLPPGAPGIDFPESRLYFCRVTSYPLGLELQLRWGKREVVRVRSLLHLTNVEAPDFVARWNADGALRELFMSDAGTVLGYSEPPNLLPKELRESLTPFKTRFIAGILHDAADPATDSGRLVWELNVLSGLASRYLEFALPERVVRDDAARDLLEQLPILLPSGVDVLPSLPELSLTRYERPFLRQGASPSVLTRRLDWTTQLIDRWIAESALTETAPAYGAPLKELREIARQIPLRTQVSPQAARDALLETLRQR